MHFFGSSKAFVFQGHSFMTCDSVANSFADAVAHAWREGSPTAISEAAGEQLETQLGQYYDKTGVSCCTELRVLIALVKLNSFKSFTY